MYDPNIFANLERQIRQLDEKARREARRGCRSGQCLYLQKAVEVLASHLGWLHAAVRPRLEQLAAKYASLGRFRQALDCFDKAVEQGLWEKGPCLEAAELLAGKRRFCNLWNQPGHLEAAQEAAAMAERALGPFHHGLVEYLVPLGLTLCQHCRWKEAAAVFARVVEFRWREGDPLRLAQALTDLGAAHAGGGEWDLAAQAYGEAIELVKEDTSEEAEEIRTFIWMEFGSLD